MGPTRTPFDRDEDALLTKYIAVYNPDKPGRMGNELYKRLVEDADNKWSWSSRHSWQSWRDRYKKNEYRFDAAIKKYQQKKKKMNLTDAASGSNTVRNGAANGQPVNSEPRANNGRAVVNGPSSSSLPPTSPPPATQHAARKGAAMTSYLEAEKAGITSDEESHDRKKMDSQGHKHIARKTARKTAVFPGYSEEEEEGDSVDRIASGHVNATQGKRKAAEEAGASGEAKRRRVQDDFPNALSNQKSLGSSRIANGSSHDRKVAEGGLNEHQHEASPSAFGQLSVAIIRSLNALLALNGPEKILDDEKIQRTVFDALQLNAEERKEAIEYAKSRLPHAAAPVEFENAENRERLYPQLTEEDNLNGLAHDDASPGAQYDPPLSTTRTPEKRIRQSDTRPGPTSPTPRSPDKVRTATQQASIRPDVSKLDRVHCERRPITNVKEPDDYFQTPSTSPETPNDPRPALSMPSSLKAQDERDDKSTEPDLRNTLPGRDPPRYARGTFSNTFLPSSGQQASRRHGPDLDTDSDTEVITLDSMHPPSPSKPKAQSKSWPPLRNKKSAEDIVYPIAESTPAPRSSGKSPSKVQITPTIITAPKIESSPPKSILKAITKREEATHTGSPVRKETLAAVRHLLWPTIAPKENRRINHEVQANLRQKPEPGPSTHYTPTLEAPLVDNSDKAAIPAWHPEATLPRGKAPSVSSTTSSDPFVIANLRKQEKGKNKEVAFARAHAKANRRETFGGFSTHQVPEFDLRTKALRSSLPGNRRASNIRRAPSSDSSSKEEEHERSQDLSRRTSFTATVDLSRDLPVADVQLNPTDKARITSAGLQFFIKSMAQNHGMSEDWVWNIFKVRNDLKATDHILAQMQAAARRACIEAMERENKEGTAGVPSTPKDSSVTGQVIKTHKASISREIDLTAVPPTQDRSFSRKRLSELQYTPGEEDPTFARLRDQYAPPSASRAARYIRTRARRSSGMMSSPSNPNVESSLRYDDEDSEKEEMEVTKALTPGRLLDSFADSSAISHANRDSSPPPMNMTDDANTSPVRQRPWSADEDRILLDAEDEEAINEIMKRRGRLAVKRRMVELNNEDSIL